LTAVASLDEYRNRLADLPPERFIGSILWFSIAGTVERTDGKRSTVPVRITHDQLEQWFEELDLDKRYLPAQIKRVDAFRNASSQVRREFDEQGEGRSAELMVREVMYNDEQVVRHIVKEQRDRRGQKLEYVPHMATLKFFRARRTSGGRSQQGAQFKWAILKGVSDTDRAHLEAMIAEIEEKFVDLSSNLHSQAIRGMVRKYVTDLNAIGVKPSGGVYFVHSSRQKTVDALQELVNRIGQGCQFHQLPLVDTEEQRQMLTDAFQDEVQNDVEGLLKDIAILNEKAKTKGGKIPATKYAELNSRFQDIVERSEEYTRVLGLAQGRAGSALELALDAIMDLLPRLDAGKK